jgi:hypothetical protein
MSDWQTIRNARFDISDYVIHLTRQMVHVHHGTAHNLPFYQAGFDRLKAIVKSGYLVPTKAARVTFRNIRTQVIKGDHPAVCFSEMPLDAIMPTLRHVDGTSYVGYGVALHKVDLFNYGGRPVLYGDNALLNALPADLQYLFMRYDPRKRGQSGYPYDFTFEREWRTRLATNNPWGHIIKGVPLLLPDDFTNLAMQSKSPGQWLYNEEAPDVRIIVARNQDVAPLRQWVNGWILAEKAEAYFKIYYYAIRKAQIISLEYVKERLEAGDQDYRKIDTLPSPKEMPDVAP